MSERDPHDLRNTQHYTNEKGDKLLTSTRLANTRLWLLIAVMTLLTAAVLSAGFMNATAQAQSSRGALTGLTLTSDAPGTLTATWDAASPVPTDYRVDWAKSDEDYQSWKVDNGHVYPAADITTATITGLEHETDYKIRARARYYRGEHEGKSWGGPWATATITVAGEPEPPPTPEPAEEEPVQHPPKEDPAPEDPAPKDTTPAAGTIETLAATDDNTGQLVLSWSAPAAPNADPTDYHVSWAKSTEDYPADTAEAGNAHPTTTTHTLAGLKYDTDYNIRVRARYSDGENAASPWNGPWTETTAQVKLPLPAAPFIGAIAVTPDGDVLLTWFNFEENDSITGYQVLRGPDADNMVVIEDDTGSSSTSYTDTEASAGQTHTYAVKARNASGLSPLSNTLTATVPAAEEEEELVTAQQNSDAVLVSNLGQTNAENAEADSFEAIGQTFVAGPSLAGFGYRFQGIRVSAFAEEVDGMTSVPRGQAVLRGDANGEPGAQVVSLTVPDDFASTIVLTEYTLSAPPGTVLRGGAKYWVVLGTLDEKPVFLGATTSTAEDQAPPPFDGWRIGDERFTDSVFGGFTSHPNPIKLAVLGEPEWLTDEPIAIDEDFPGADYNAHLTRGVVITGTASTGQLTTSVDRNHGQTGDYWYLDTKPGRSYRVEVTFGGSPGISTGGSAGINFLDPDGVDYASSCCESDHNREDSATFVHFTHSHQSREWNRRYMVKVAAFDLYNEGTAVYNGPYLITLTDITGVQQMVHSFRGGTDYPATELLESGEDTGDIAVSFRTGPHPDGYTLDRIKVLFNHIPAGGAIQVVALHPDVSGSPGNTEECYLRTSRIAESAVAWKFKPPHTFLATFCASVTLTANTTYWIVFPMTNRNDEVVALATTPEVTDSYGSGWSVVGSGKRGSGTWETNTDAQGRIGLWAEEN